MSVENHISRSNGKSLERGNLVMKMTDSYLESIEPTSKRQYVLVDTNLYLFVESSGAKYGKSGMLTQHRGNRSIINWESST